MTTDPVERAAPFLAECGACDYGIPSACTCPDGDYRPVMLDLVREVERLRATHDLEQARHIDRVIEVARTVAAAVRSNDAHHPKPQDQP